MKITEKKTPGLPPTKLFVCCILYCFFSTTAQTIDPQEEEIQFYRHSGIQPLVNAEQEGDLSPGTYLIPHDILVAKGKVITIYPGTKILFTQNAMLVVNGTLVCSGTKDAPVIFRKLDNRSYFRPIDPRVETRWDGIYLPDSAKLTMSNTIISDSKYGIVVSGKDVSMALDSVRFIDNKFQNVKIGERMMKIADNSPIVFRYPEQEGVFVEPVAVHNVTETIQHKNHRGYETAYPQLRIGMAITAGAGLVLGAVGVAMYRHYSEDTDDEQSRAKANAGRVAAIGGAVLFGVGAVGFAWTFFY
ncbi:MAG: hypothetical protein JXA18_01375 [Chitinispirillaceae bacterium]|nr:hypothetical protein [Chitinispirillaceae bacterium]